MKLNILNNEYHFKPQDIQRYQINEQVNNNFSKGQSTYPQDKVDVSSIARCVIQSIDNRQVEFTYSIALKKVSAEIINKDGSRIEVKNEILPKELREISCPKVFDAFLKNTYAKISVLSNGDNKLNINHRLLGGMLKAKKSYESGSITPTTQGKTQFSFSKSSDYINKKENRIIESKEIFRKIKELDQKITNPLELLGNHDILNNHRLFQELDHITDDNFIFQLEYKENIENTSSLIATPLVKRFGINPEAIQKAVGYNITYDKLHYVEQTVLENAFQELNTKISAETLQKMKANEYLNNIVLVDIFARKQGTIKIDQSTNLPETHTIVLWKKTDKDVLLIDPSKFDFSEHIANSLNLIKDVLKIEQKILPSDIEGGIIYATQEKNTGYSEYDSKDPMPRDCIDIAVKIAFEINEQQLRGTNITKIEENVFSQISNKKKLSKAVTNVDNTFIRELQSSNLKVREEAKQFLESNEVQPIIKTVVAGNLISIGEVFRAYDFLKKNTKNLLK